jgi:hypothetical protein
VRKNILSERRFSASFSPKGERRFGGVFGIGGTMFHLGRLAISHSHNPFMARASHHRIIFDHLPSWGWFITIRVQSHFLNIDWV